MTTWLHRIVVNACLDRLRRRPTQPLPAGDLLESWCGPDLGHTRESRDAHAGTEVALDVGTALARLPEGQRLALVLVDMHGLSIAEMRVVLQVAEGTVGLPSASDPRYPVSLR